MGVEAVTRYLAIWPSFVALMVATPLLAWAPSVDDMEVAHKLAASLYDLPETNQIPGLAEKQRELASILQDKIKPSSSSEEGQMKLLRDRLIPALRQGCVTGVRSEISRRLADQLSSNELMNLQRFSESPAGTVFFSTLRQSAYQSNDADPAIFALEDAPPYLDDPTKQHFRDFYSKLILNEDHWIRSTCNAGQAASLSQLTDEIRASYPQDANNGQDLLKGGSPIENDPTYQAAVVSIRNGDFVKALGPLQQLSNYGNISAKTLLASMYYNGRGVQIDYRAAFDLFRQAADANDAEGQYNLGVLYLNGHGTSKDSRKAFDLFFRSAEAGYAPSELLVAERYKLGDGVQQDPEKALIWYQKAADDGYAKAQDYLGEMYQSGSLVGKDYLKAALWHGKAAQQGYAYGQFNLGRLYENGLGVPQDYARSFQLYQQAADQGLPHGQYGLGIAYSFGKGVPLNLATAIHWYTKAASQCYADAEFALGALYSAGEGVRKDMTVALKWYLRAAGHQHGGAQFNLGFAYGLGEGVPIDIVEAYKWFALSASRPETAEPGGAIKNRDYAASQMTPAQLQRAKKLVSDWLPTDLTDPGKVRECAM
jgi:TPR repeat protein